MPLNRMTNPIIPAIEISEASGLNSSVQPERINRIPAINHKIRVIEFFILSTPFSVSDLFSDSIFIIVFFIPK